jgi:hypothetical protein
MLIIYSGIKIKLKVLLFPSNYGWIEINKSNTKEIEGVHFLTAKSAAQIQLSPSTTHVCHSVLHLLDKQSKKYDTYRESIRSFLIKCYLAETLNYLGMGVLPPRLILREPVRMLLAMETPIMAVR